MYEFNRKRRRRIVSLVIILLIIIASLTPFFFESVRNRLQGFAQTYGYEGLFIFAFIGGISTLFPLPYPLAVIALANLDFNPLFLGITAGFGAALGDSVSYFVGYRSFDVLHADIQEQLIKRREFLLSHTWLVAMGQLVYSTFSPLPDDVVIIPLGAARYPYIRSIIPVTIGKMIFNTVIAVTGVSVVNLFF